MRAADGQAYQGWQRLLATAAENLDRAWVALTSEPRRVDQRQHPLKGALGVVKVGGMVLEQWQYEVTRGGRIWYAIDDGRTSGSPALAPAIRNRPTPGAVELPFVV